MKAGIRVLNKILIGLVQLFKSAYAKYLPETLSRFCRIDGRIVINQIFSDLPDVSAKLTYCAIPAQVLSIPAGMTASTK
jgi:hypothetical protein